MIGTVLKNIESGKKLGCIVHYNPRMRQAIIFRTSSPDHPSFGRINLASSNNIEGDGNINDYSHSDLKQYLLRYITTRNLSSSEEKVMSIIRDYAFPNGLPKYDSGNSLDANSAEHLSLDLDNTARPGRCLYINTPAISPFQHLDNHKVYVISRDEHGLWVCTMDGSAPITSYLPFKVKPISGSDGVGLVCHGISRMMPLDEAPNRRIVEGYNNLDKDGISQIIVRGTRIKILPQDSNKVVIPSTIDYKGKYYDYRIGDLVKDPVGLSGLANINSASGRNNVMGEVVSAGSISSMYDNEARLVDNALHGVGNVSVASRLGNMDNSDIDILENSIMGDDEYSDDGLLDILDSMDRLNSKEIIDSDSDDGDSDEGSYSGNGASYCSGSIDSKLGKTGKNQKGKGMLGGGNGDSGIDDILDSEIQAIMKEDGGIRRVMRNMDNNSGVDSDKGDKSNSKGDKSNSDIGSDSEGELEFVDDDDVEELGVYQKVRQMPVPEADKVYKESIQRGRLLKQKLEKIPSVFRDNPMWLNRIRKEVNTISMLKALGTVIDSKKIDDTGSRVLLRVPEYKPLVEKMLNFDFTNNILIPLVGARKRIYLQTRDTISADEFDPDNTEVIEDTYKHLENQELLVKVAPGGGIVRRTINIDNELGRIVSENVPEIAHNNTVGLLFRLGEGIQPEISSNTGFGTTKLQMQRAKERQAFINQDTTVVRYGGGEGGLSIQNYGIEQTMYDTFRAVGPLGRYVGDDKLNLTIDEVEAMENQVDRNIDISTGKYKVYYNGDNLSLLGFVRPPIAMGKNGGKVADLGKEIAPDSLKKRINEAEEEGRVLIRKIGKRYVDTDDNDLDIMESPDKFIVYMMPMDGKLHLDGELLKKHLKSVIPDIDSYVNALKDNYKPQTPDDIAVMVSALEKLEYFYPSNTEMIKILAASTVNSLKGAGDVGIDRPPHASNMPVSISYDDYQPLKDIEAEVSKRMMELSKKLDRTIKLGKYRRKKTEERESLHSSDGSRVELKGAKGRKGIVVGDELVEMANKVYGDIDGYNLDLSVPMADKEEITRLEFYASQDDNGQYMNMLIHMSVLERLDKELDKAALELELENLRGRYDNKMGEGSFSDRVDKLKPALKDKLRMCNAKSDRKPKIMKYPSLERLDADNGHVITNMRGEVIRSGDYALIMNGSGDGKHLIYKREELASGDYWIAQPISALEDLIKKKKKDCNGISDTMDGGLDNKVGKDKDKDMDREGSREDMMRLPEDSERCGFDISKIECMPGELIEMDDELAALESQISDIKGQLDMALAVPVMLKEVKEGIAKYGSRLSAKISSRIAVRKYNMLKDRELAQELVTMRNKKQDCPHFRATEYLDSLKNISTKERYHLVMKILDIYADQEQSSGLDLSDIGGDPDNNFVRCHVCGQHLMCKHNLYAITLLTAGDNDNDDVDDELMAAKYGYETTGSIYCRICGYFLSNTAVQDIEEFEKRAGKDGLHTKTREVIDQRDIIEQQRAAIGNIMREALQTETTGDMKFRLRIYKLVKDLAGLYMLSVEDELEMVNFIKSYGFVSKKTFYTKLYVMFLRLKKAAPVSALDKLANDQYWMHVTADIMAMFLVILQTSRSLYQVYNSLCINNIMGWPLLRDGKDQPGGRSGLEFMNCLAKQMVLAPGGDFAYLNPIEKFGALLERRMDELLKVDAYVRDKLENALDDKYQHITFLDEMEKASVTQWPTYRPALTFWEGGVKWQPSGSSIPSVDKIIKDWEPATIYKVMELVRNNIGYQAQLLASDLARVVGESEPTTLFTRLSSIGNGCCPIDIWSEQQRIGKYSNPELFYYMLPIRRIPEIANHIKKIDEYQYILRIIGRVLYSTRYRLISSRPGAGIDWYREPIVNMGVVSSGIIHEYFLNYVDAASQQTAHGRQHLFDTYGRCLISNQLKKDIEEVNYTDDDFRRLMRAVMSRKVVYRQSLVENGIQIHIQSNAGILAEGVDSDIGLGGGLRYDASILLAEYMGILSKLIDLTREQKGKGVRSGMRLECPHLEKIYKNIREALQYKLVAIMAMEPKLYSSMEVIVRELRVVSRSFDILLGLFSEMDKKWRIMWEVLTKICHVLCGRFDEVCIRWLNVGIFPIELRMKDIQKRYFDIISMLDTQMQNQIDNLVDLIGRSHKDETEYESILVDLGNLKEIKKDYENFLEKQIGIIPHIGGVYYSKDILTSKRAGYAKARFMSKMMADLSRIASQLENNTWKGLKTAGEIKDKYNTITEFFQYTNNSVLIARFAPITRIVSALGLELMGGIFPISELLQVEPGILQAELVANMIHYALVWSLGQYLESIIGEKSKTVTTMVSSGDSDAIGPNTELDELERQREADIGQTPDDMVGLEGLGDAEMDLYPELVVEGSDGFGEGEEGEGEEKGDMEGEGEEQEGGNRNYNFRNKLVETRNTNKNIVISYVRDCIIYVGDNHRLVDDLNESKIAELIAKTEEQQIRRNLNTFKFLNEEGMEDDYRMIRERMLIGKLKFADLGDYMDANFGMDDQEDMEEVDDRETKNYNRDINLDNIDEVAASEAEAKKDRYGFSNHEHQEMGYIGEVEDMEDAELDYGYMGVD